MLLRAGRSYRGTSLVILPSFQRHRVGIAIDRKITLSMNKIDKAYTRIDSLPTTQYMWHRNSAAAHREPVVYSSRQKCLENNRPVK